MAAIHSTSVLEPDQRLEEDDVDSTLGDDVASSTQSISSSVLNYRQENGRSYHRYKDGKYSFPNDQIENERLDLQHHLFLMTFEDKLGFAPPNDSNSNVQRVLDIGTGTGIWAIDFADEHPQAKVIGVDLSPIQPDFTPPNAEFQIDDIEEQWTYSEPFDYIHSRMMTSSVASWPKYLDVAFQNLVPGGYLELQEIDLRAKSDDGTLTPDLAMSKWLRLLGEAAYTLERPYQDVKELKALMIAAGFTDVVEKHYRWPTNAWPRDAKYKELGRWHNWNITSGLEGLSIAPLTRALGWTKEEVTVFLAQVKKDLDNPHVHAYWPICSIYGKRPE